MKKLKWLVPILVVSMIFWIIACKHSTDPHYHIFSKEWTSDETNHWHASICGHAKEVSGKAAHTFGDWTTTLEATEEAEGSKERTCSVCGYTATEVIAKLPHEHKFADSWTSDETNHWKAATCEHTKEVSEKSAHTFGDWTITKEATEEAAGSKERTCSVCEYKAIEEIEKLAHTHKFATEWSKDKDNHWYASTCGHDVTEGKAAHTFGEWTVTKEFTVTLDSFDVAKKIPVIKAVREITGLALGEAKAFVESVPKELKAGVSKTDADDIIAKLSEAGGSASKFCEEEIQERSCSVCGYKETNVHIHTYSEAWTRDANGHWHEATCEHTTEVSGKAEHTFGEYVSNNDATTDADGTKTRECSVCGYKDTGTDEGSKIIVPGFVFVKGGTVTGAAYTNNYEGVFIEGRTVTLSDFYMGKYEVTQEEYASVMAGQKVTVDGKEYELESNPSYCTADSTSFTLFNGDVQEKRPVEGVSWYDAVWYCNALSEKEGLTKAYNIEVTQVKQASGKTGYYIYEANVTLNANANGYRLPTEAEWEYAARGGDPTKEDWNYVFSGADTASYNSYQNADLDSVGWYCYNNITGITGDSDVTNNVSGRGTHQVGKKAPNRLGLYDMSGNVWEWCYDWKETITTTTPADGAASGSFRVYRGGGWGSYANASVSSREGNGPYDRGGGVGFRVVRPSSVD